MKHQLQRRTSSKRQLPDVGNQHTTQSASETALSQKTGNYTPDQLLQLQRTVGNTAVQRMLSTGGALVQRALDGSQKSTFRRYIGGATKGTDNIDKYALQFGGSAKDKAKKANWQGIKQALEDRGLPTDDDAIAEGALIAAEVKGNGKPLLVEKPAEVVVTTEEETGPTMPDDPIEAFNMYVVQETGCDIEKVDDPEGWKTLIANSLVKGGDEGGMITFVKSVKGKKETMASDVRHMTQPSMNRSIWYKREGDHGIRLFALASHIRGDNTKYRAITKASSMPGSWTLNGREATAGA